jgi:hypothetical protein
MLTHDQLIWAMVQTWLVLSSPGSLSNGPDGRADKEMKVKQIV